MMIFGSSHDVLSNLRALRDMRRLRNYQFCYWGQLPLPQKFGALNIFGFKLSD